MNTDNIASLLLEYEQRLLQPETRQSTQQLEHLLADEFIEFASSGTIYKKTDILKHLVDESNHHFHFELSNFAIKLLADNTALVTYHIVKTNTDNNHIIPSLRSSIWQLRDNNWQMVFHQGTITKKCRGD